MLARSFLAGASVIALTIGAQAAHAGTPAIIWGGGGTSSAKVYRDIFNCYVTAADGIYATTPGNPSTVAYPTAPAAGCSTQGKVNVIVTYEPVGTKGISAFTEANPTAFQSPASTNTIAYLDSTFGISSTPYPEIQFATADVYLTSTQASAASTAVGEPIFQLPAIVEPTTIPVGKTQNVKLKTADLCNLFSGSTSVAEKITFSEVVVRGDSAGASYIFADWLAQNCPSNLGFNSTNGFPSTSPNWAAVFTANGSHITLVQAIGAAGMASAVSSTTNAIGYVTPDYVYPVVTTSTAYPAYVNNVQPTVAAVKVRLAAYTYPKTYNAATIGQQINDGLVAPGGKGYQIIGYSFWDVYQCYSTTIAGGLIGGPTQGKDLLNLLKYVISNNTEVDALINGQGFAAAGSPVINLLNSAGGPFNATGGIQNSACPSK